MDPADPVPDPDPQHCLLPRPSTWYGGRERRGDDPAPRLRPLALQQAHGGECRPGPLTAGSGLLSSPHLRWVAYHSRESGLRSPFFVNMRPLC